MKIVHLTCDQCGAPLEAPARARRFACDYCGSKLEVDASKPEHPPRPPQMEQSDELRRRLQKVDDAWVRDRERFVRKGRDGFSRIPGVVIPVLFSAMGIAFGVFFMTDDYGPSHAPHLLFRIFGAFFALVSLSIGVTAVSRVFQFTSRRRRFRDERRQLLHDD